MPSEAVIRTRHLTDEVADRLASHILSAGLPPGDRLPSADALASSYGVSRTVIREALSRLKAEGLVETRQGSGAFVAREHAGRPFRLPARSPEAEDTILYVLELRATVETEAAALAAARHTPDDLHEIRRHLLAMEHAASGEDGIEHDRQFHRAIAVASGNPLFPLLIDFLVQHCRGAILAVRQHPTEWASYASDAGAEHRAVLAAIEVRDPDKARAAMRDHLNAGMRRISSAIP